MKKVSIDFNKNPKLAITCRGFILCEHDVRIHAGGDPIDITGTNVTDDYPDNNADPASDVYTLPTPSGKYVVIRWRLTFALYDQADKYVASIHVLADDKVVDVAHFSHTDEGESGTLRVETGLLILEPKEGDDDDTQ
jgi:hypothetical protein